MFSLLWQIDREDVSWEKLQAIYLSNSPVFDRDASQVTISKPSGHGLAGTPSSIFNIDWNKTNYEMEHAHIQWCEI